jgi:hypothetical protein
MPKGPLERLLRQELSAAFVPGRACVLGAFSRLGESKGEPA